MNRSLTSFSFPLSTFSLQIDLRRLHGRFACVWLLTLVICNVTAVAGDENLPAARRERSMQFHQRSQQRTGLLIPFYLYPANIHTNPTYNRLMDLKRKYETIPFWVIMNPASGPGDKVDANYTKAIDRLQGAGCTILGYVPTNYAKRPSAEVQSDIDLWMKLYPRTHGIFFDEMIYDDREDAVQQQVRLNKYAREKGFWPTVGNPGTDTLDGTLPPIRPMSSSSTKRNPGPPKRS